MNFSGQYLTYAEYKNLGGTLDVTPFNLLEFQSRRQIDKKTLNRLRNVDNIPNEVKICMYSLINRLETYTNSSQGIADVKSENTDGYSVSYVSSAEIDKVVNSKNTELNDIITTDLLGLIVNGEHVLYVGVR